MQVEISAPVNGCHSLQLYFRRGQTGREKYSATLRVAVRARAAYKEFPDCSWDPCSETVVDMQAWEFIYSTRVLSALQPSVLAFCYLPTIIRFMSIAQISKRCLCQLIDVKGKSQPQDFSLYRDIFTVAEQRILLATALQKLDSLESRAFRRRRDAFIRGLPKETLKQSQDPLDLFLPDEYYQMEEVCFCFVLQRLIVQ